MVQVLVGPLVKSEGIQGDFVVQVVYPVTEFLELKYQQNVRVGVMCMVMCP